MRTVTRLCLSSDVDVVAARRAVTESARQLGLSTLGCTKLATAVSELARNTVVHGLGGIMSIESVRDGHREGLRITFEDHGPGIVDIDRAFEDGYSTAGGMGLGLPGSRRLVNELVLTSTVGVGTSVAIVWWKE